MPWVLRIIKITSPRGWPHTGVLLEPPTESRARIRVQRQGHGVNDLVVENARCSGSPIPGEWTWRLG